jgi:hypothetical protein
MTTRRIYSTDTLSAAERAVAAARGGGAAGALIGTWTSAMAGATVPDPVRRHYEREIEAGRILLVIDADEHQHHLLAPRLEALGVVRLDAGPDAGRA